MFSQFSLITILFATTIGFSQSSIIRVIDSVDSNLIIYSDSLYDGLGERIDRLESNQLKDQIEFAKEHIQRANRIIDWSAMFFGAFGIILTIVVLVVTFTGILGLRELTNVKEIHREMDAKLKEVTDELSSIQSYREDIINDTKKYVETSYYFYEGKMAYNYGDYIKGIDLLDKVLEIKGVDLDVLFIKGKCLVREEKFDYAIQTFNKMLEVDPNNSSAYFGLAMSHRYMLKHNEALIYAKKAVDIDSKKRENWDYLGLIYRERHELADAITCHEKAYSIKRSSTASFLLGLIHFVQGDLKLSNKFLTDAEMLARERVSRIALTPWSRFHIGVCEGLNGNMAEARINLEAAIHHNSSKSIRTQMIQDLEFLLLAKRKTRNIKTMLNVLKIRA